MPIYEYRCQACDERFDRLFASIRQAHAEVVCPACQSNRVRRVFSAPSFRTGGEGGGEQQEEETPASRPPVFGRKELNAALEKKRSLGES